MPMNSPRRKCVQPQLLGDVLQDVLRTSGLAKKAKEYEIVSQWSAIVGDKIAEHAAPIEIKAGVLFVQVKNAAWRGQLAFFKNDLIEKINAHAGTKIVRSIFFT